ncbi:MAG: hypothetical protein OEW04_06805 [Nitrospirota bacterium]|nr:hypothetical protein [Nitrospirota bacterium]
MKTGIKVLFVTGIMGIAVVAGAFQALNSPRKSGKKEEEQEKGKAEKA